jgi:hypothetical protein
MKKAGGVAQSVYFRTSKSNGLDGGRGLNLARKEEEQEEEMLLFSHFVCP